MKIVRQFWEFEYLPANILEIIERAGRTCYKTEGSIAPGTAEKFVRKIINSGHLSVIEHVNISARMITDRGVTHELVRHRLASYSQECLSGDTLVKKNLTIRDLYNSQRRGVSLKSVSFGRVINNWANKVFYKGRAEVFEVKTKLGYSIKTTLAHEFQTSNEIFVRLGNLNVGDQIKINGRKSLLKINDGLLKEEYLINKLNPFEISEKYQAPYRSVLNRLHKLEIFENHLHDKNLEKYQKNHTPASIEQMRQTILMGYENGRTPWNIGLSGDDNEGVKHQADTLRKFHHNNKVGELNSNWRGGPTKHILARQKKFNLNECELCNRSVDTQVHHIDGDPENNNDENLIKVCINCHSKLHCGWWVGIITHSDEIVAIESVGEEDIYDIEMAAPFHNYIANGFVVHNSTRYCNYFQEKFGNEITVILPVWFYGLDVDEIIKKYDADGPPYNPEDITEKKFIHWLWILRQCEYVYFDLLKLGQTPQEARAVLPNSLKTEIVVTTNLREWRHIFTQRTSKAAHPQFRDLMINMLEGFKEKIPIIFDDINHNKGE